MRIAYLHQYFATPDMPAGTRSFEFASRLVRQGHDVHVVTSDREPGAKRRTTIEGGATVHWFPVPYANRMNARQRLWAFARFALASARTTRRIDADLVYATSTPLTIAIPAIIGILGRAAPLVFEVRDLWPEVPIAMGALRSPLARHAAYALERVAYGHSTRVVALSEEMRDGVSRAGYPAAAIRVVPNGCDTDRFTSPDVSADRYREKHPETIGGPVVMYVGTLGRVNGLEYMVDLAAAALDEHPTLRFVCVGNGIVREELRLRAEELGVLGVNFFLVPPVPKRELPDALAAAAVATSFVMDIPELGGNSANKVFDGLAAGRPVVVNAEGSIAELLRKSGAGLVLERDVSAAADELGRFLADEERYTAAKLAAAELANGEFSRETLYGRFEQVLSDALREGRVRRHLAPRRRGA